PGNPAADQDESLPQQVLKTYMGNIALVKALGTQYHFQYLFYWQPTIFQKSTLTPYETVRRSEMQTIEQFYRKTYEVVQQSRLTEQSGAHFYDLSSIFADVKEPIYVDWCHLGESGNAIIAKQMAHDILAVIAANAGTATPGVA